MKDNTFKVIVEYSNNSKREAAIVSETPEKAIEKAIRENHLPLNFIDDLPIFWMNYDPNEKILNITNSDQNYKVTLTTYSNYKKSIFSNNEISECDITSVVVEKV